jgi:succinate dehydrogenase / fumarate reductase iron-sulfur subunit
MKRNDVTLHMDAQAPSSAQSGGRKVKVKIKRQDAPGKQGYWEEFELNVTNDMNVISVLEEIRRNPVNSSGKNTNAIVWDCSCLEEVCGACSMVINGRARQACSALVKDLGNEILLEPMDKFPIVRDLRVDRKRMFEALKRVEAWVPVDGYHDLGAGPRMSDADASERYDLSRCMTCGVCLQVCPQVNEGSDFIGAAAISQARLFNAHPVGESLKENRLEALMDKGGIMDCGKAQNCVKACPKEIPLTESIAEMYRQTTLKAVKDIFRK